MNLKIVPKMREIMRKIPIAHIMHLCSAILNDHCIKLQITKGLHCVFKRFNCVAMELGSRCRRIDIINT